MLKLVCNFSKQEGQVKVSSEVVETILLLKLDGTELIDSEQFIVEFTGQQSRISLSEIF